MQRALSIVQRWCTAEKLSVNPNKTELVLFTKSQKVERFTKPTPLTECYVHTTGSVKYPGFILDAKLTWLVHVKLRIIEASSFFWLCHDSLQHLEVLN
jgi:hypothetical protein